MMVLYLFRASPLFRRRGAADSPNGIGDGRDASFKLTGAAVLPLADEALATTSIGAGRTAPAPPSAVDSWLVPAWPRDDFAVCALAVVSRSVAPRSALDDSWNVE